MLRQSINQAFDNIDLPVDNIQAFQTTRLSPNKGKASVAPYDAFNLGLHVGDDPQQVLNNRSQLLSYLPAKANIQWLEQVHGAYVEKISIVSDKPLVADAIITQTPKLALAIMTADCLPILLASKDGDEIAAIHGGWRPLAAGIIKHTLEMMQTDNKEIVAWLGPCIGKEAFEVGAEVKEAFISISETYVKAFTQVTDDKWLADLPYISIQMLFDCGVETIINDHYCTFSNNHRYYSYRKAPQTGRMASLICIN
ncbi:laccase domain protein [Thalassotalea insulae]|uniref:Purine nucleoside phosphorylase n=1 Tax=Thalassotalea insulae TaxID=2056778 RepID=A0ABQ6GVU9_9GAMM|nr:peptidoglycan editing factor PgeF [Thalassotalea insulae]GLX80051.1 laccase domain protein [Thalassotalea insulae]